MKLSNLILMMGLLATQAYADQAKAVWTNYQGNAAHTGYADVNVDLAKLKVDWSREFGCSQDRHGKFSYQAAVTDRMIYFTIADSVNTCGISGVYALNKTTGENAWQVPVNNQSYLSGAVYGNGNVYVTEFTGDIGKTIGYINAYNAETGALQYSNPLTMRWYDTYHMPVIFGDHIYLGQSKKQYSLLAESGQVEWLTAGGDRNQNIAISKDYVIRTERENMSLLNRANGGDKILISGMESSEDTNHGTPVWDEKRKVAYAVMVPETDHKPGWITTQLIAFDAVQRKAKWTLTLPAIIQPVLADDKLYFSSDHKVYEVDAETGKINWTWQSPAGALDMVVTRDLIFVESYSNGTTYAISRKTHEKVWEIEQHGRMSVDQDHLYLVNGYGLHVKITAIALH